VTSFAFRVIDPAVARRRKNFFRRAVLRLIAVAGVLGLTFAFVVDGYGMRESMVQMNSGAQADQTHRFAATKASTLVESVLRSIGRLLVKFTHRKRERVEAEYHAGEWMRVLRERGWEKVPTP